MQSLRARHMGFELETVKSAAIRLSVNTTLDNSGNCSYKQIPL